MTSPKFAWSITASIVDDCIQVQQISPLEEPQSNDDNHGFSGFDMSQSTEWMECLETKEKRQDDVGGAGAYDTMRCDLVLDTLSRDSSNHRPRIWGKDYHLQRLQQSYQSLLQATDTAIDKQQLEKARTTSEAILKSLLSEAETSAALKKSAELDDDTVIQLLRVTLLWSPQKTTKDDDAEKMSSQCENSIT
ncbi:MAG: hypothetical protein SGARI_008126, partial [Bacillariaceae sp.]